MVMKPKPEVYWTNGTVYNINLARLGKGGVINCSDGKKYGVNCFVLPQDANIGDQYRVFISFGKLLQMVPLIESLELRLNHLDPVKEGEEFEGKRDGLIAEIQELSK